MLSHLSHLLSCFAALPSHTFGQKLYQSKTFRTQNQFLNFSIIHHYENKETCQFWFNTSSLYQKAAKHATECSVRDLRCHVLLHTCDGDRAENTKHRFTIGNVVIHVVLNVVEWQRRTPHVQIATTAAPRAAWQTSGHRSVIWAVYRCPASVARPGSQCAVTTGATWVPGCAYRQTLTLRDQTPTISKQRSAPGLGPCLKVIGQGHLNKRSLPTRCFYSHDWQTKHQLLGPIS